MNLYGFTKVVYSRFHVTPSSGERSTTYSSEPMGLPDDRDSAESLQNAGW
jgi:hypothetical protein